MCSSMEPIGKSDAMATYARIAAGRAGRVTVLACPQCDGAVYEYADGDALSFRCERGHSYRPNRFCAGAEDDLRRAVAGILGALALR